MAGARLGVGIGCEELMADLNTIKYSTNPYNVNRMTQAAGVGALQSAAEIRANCDQVCENRAWTVQQLQRLGFTLTDSAANFVFMKHPVFQGSPRNPDRVRQDRKGAGLRNR